jgi:hypothetical protein
MLPSEGLMQAVGELLVSSNAPVPLPVSRAKLDRVHLRGHPFPMPASGDCRAVVEQIWIDDLLFEITIRELPH